MDESKTDNVKRTLTEARLTCHHNTFITTAHFVMCRDCRLAGLCMTTTLRIVTVRRRGALLLHACVAIHPNEFHRMAYDDEPECELWKTRMRGEGRTAALEDRNERITRSMHRYTRE